VDAWLLRACGKLGIRLIHSTPHRPQGRGKIERFWRTVNDQFLVEVTDTTAEQLAAKGMSEAAGLWELNRLFTAWVETAYHHHVHSETGQTPIARWADGWDRVGRRPAMPSVDALTEAFLWSQQRTVTKTSVS
jgi:putative transposase